MRLNVKKIAEIATATQKEMNKARGLDYTWKFEQVRDDLIRCFWSYLGKDEHIDITAEQIDSEDDETVVKIFDVRRGGTVSYVMVGEAFWCDTNDFQNAEEFTARELVLGTNNAY